ncbi:MAG: 1-(5-phosphoribosyl)-5-[(5-phosphoribosylamino)methylideneamino]imidazole-4-carboxamide isomerase [Candidatus Omnitrophota bacterium]|nr:1-(5-phosphoribosyl)-5-[(5-phosphoribosylamino)methylideneamino]imidazole-4-carboxamide isomerase [Candidatus Omnitrophota bacterium]
MLIIPAIDIKDGKVVRLWQGDFNKIKAYSDSPESVALEWQRQGAKFLHIVDLDGACSGKLENLSAIKKIAKIIKIPFEVGGGIRSLTTIKQLINLGVKRIVLGTKVLQDKNFLKEAIVKFRGMIIVSIDVRENKVASDGWLRVGNLDAMDFARELKRLGLETIIYTDIKRDGTLTGPNFGAIEEMVNDADLKVIASGGVSSLKDLRELRKLEKKGLIGVVVGKALYENRFILREAIKVAGK